MTNHPTSTPIVSAVIVNRNGAEHLRICLPSLRAQSYGAIEIIVVDNASSDDSAAVAESSGARWLSLNENIGLGPALNRGAAIAKGEFLLFVNNDMRFHADFAALLVAPLVNDQSLFATDGMQYNWDGTAKGHLATRLMTGRLGDGASTELVPGLSFYLEDKKQITPVFMASVASMLVRRSYFEKIGGFDEDIPLSYEDVDICWRAWIAGWKTVYVPSAVCWHRVGSSCQSEEGALFLFYGVLKGRLAFASRLLPMPYAFTTWLVSLGGLFKDASRLRWRFAWMRIKILAEFAMKAPKFFAAKKALFKEAGTTPGEQLERMLQLGKKEIEVTRWSGSREKSAAV